MIYGNITRGIFIVFFAISPGASVNNDFAMTRYAWDVRRFWNFLRYCMLLIINERNNTFICDQEKQIILKLQKIQ